MKTTYELKKLDDTLYVSVEPLMNDVLDALNTMKEINTEGLDNVDQQQMRLKILGLEAIYTFLGGLVTEQNLKDLREKYGVKNYGPEQIIH